MSKQLTLEVRTDKALAEPLIAGGRVVITPPIGEDWWLFRVKLSAKQAILGFPKFGVVGIGFAKETDWNTNLPSQCEATEIFNHIKHNKGDKRIKDSDCVAAIQLIQSAVKQYSDAPTV